MGTIDLTSVFTQGVAWLTATGIVGFALNWLMRHEVLPKFAWYIGLGLTFLVLVPFPSFVKPQLVSLSWISDSEFVGEMGQHIVKGGIFNLSGFGSSSGAILIALLLLVSGWRVIKLFKDYKILKNLVTQGIPFQSENVLYPTYLTPLGSSAFAMGVFHPVIALPDYFLSLPKSQQHMLLAHEHTHIKEGDHIAVFFWRLICELCWFNPFLRNLSQGFNQSMEYQCDTKTIRQAQYSKVAYARTLLACLRLDANAPVISPSAGFSTPGLSFKDYKKRLKLIVSENDCSLNKVKFRALMATIISLMLGLNSAMAAFNAPEESWIYPVNVPQITSVFGNIAAIRANKPHRGLDLKGPIGTPIYASASGKVTIADDSSLSGAYGLVIVIQHQHQWQSLYAHLSEVTVKPGQEVSQGDVIGLMGQSGKVTGPHLHFELAHKQQPIDPLTVIKKEEMRANHL